MIQTLALAMACVLSVFSDGDRVLKKLTAAKANYQSELKKFSATVDEWLEKQEAGARRDGDRKQLERLKANRAAFASKEALPVEAPVPYHKRQEKFRGAMESAYLTAIKEYTKAGMDKAAEDVEAELAKLQLLGRGVGHALGGCRRSGLA